MGTIKQRVEEGIKFMTEEYGKSWLRKIDPETLALRDGNACVLGQVEGDYSEGLTKLELDYDKAVELGFDASGQHRGGTTREFDALTRTWKQSIRRLQKLFRISAPSMY